MFVQSADESQISNRYWRAPRCRRQKTGHDGACPSNFSTTDAVALQLKNAQTHCVSEFQFGGEFVWWPSPELVAQSNLQRFIHKHELGSYDELMKRSTTDIDWFWNAVLCGLQIHFYKPYAQIVDLSQGKPWPKWCVGGDMNVVHNMVDKYAGTPVDDRLAIKSETEDGTTRTLTYRELRRQVNIMAAGLHALGLGKGDAIGVFMPMVPEIVVAMLAIIKIGGIFLPLFSGFGAAAIVSRLQDADAKALFTADGTYRRGKLCPMKLVALQAAAQIPTLRHLVILKTGGEWMTQVVGVEPAKGGIEIPLPDKTVSAASEPTERTSAEDPMMIIYTSGTTGKPKGAVHTHCGFPIKSAQDMWMGLDLHADETLFWMTDMGWMMGPWEVFGTLLLGATMMLYDGAPDFPGPDRTWQLVDRHHVTALGVSPTLIRALRRHGDEIVHQHDLSSLRKFASTGEPWNPDPWLWLFQNVGGGKLPIINYSGGTEISGGIVMGNVLTPMKPCAFSGPLPGMAADVVDENGNSVRGQVSELVIREPWIGMTRGFWKDRQRYIDAYWSRFPDVWVHGDWAAIDDDGLWYILGRSDDTIKIAGKRVGPAEVESVLVAHAKVSEAAAVGVPDSIKGEALVCFCLLKPGTNGDVDLAGELKTKVASELGKALAPKEVLFVGDIPKTRNAKVMRRIVRAAYLGEKLGDTSALENPSAVEEIARARLEARRPA
ncbi:MAG: AMP-binding protein [Chthoniobacterales bacterium]